VSICSPAVGLLLACFWFAFGIVLLTQNKTKTGSGADQKKTKTNAKQQQNNVKTNCGILKTLPKQQQNKPILSPRITCLHHFTPHYQRCCTIQ
jgi:hypothetical protein